MANYSDVTIELESENQEVINGLFEKIKSNGYGVDEEFIIPLEEKDNWYDWMLDNIGTKWDMLKPIEGEWNDSVIELNDNKIYLSFESPWCGPNIWFKRLCEKYNLSGTMIDSESGCDFIQRISYEDGIEVEDITDSYLSKLAIDIRGKNYMLEWYFEEYSSIEEVEEDQDWLIDDFVEAGVSLLEIENYVKGEE